MVKRQNALRVAQYNCWVRHVRDLTTRMVERTQSAPPESYSWVLEGGQWKASWELWRSPGDAGRINLILDGRLVTVRGTAYGAAHAEQVLSTLPLEEIKRTEEEGQRRINWGTLAALYCNIVTIWLERLGVEPTPELYNAILENWGQS